MFTLFSPRKRQQREIPSTPQPVQGRIYDFIDPDKLYHTMPVYSRHPYGPRRSLSSCSTLPDPRPYGPYYTTENGHHSGRSTPSSHLYESPTSQRRFIYWLYDSHEIEEVCPCNWWRKNVYSDSTCMASQMASNSTTCSTACWGWEKRQKEITRILWGESIRTGGFPSKGGIMRKAFPCHGVSDYY